MVILLVACSGPQPGDSATSDTDPPPLPPSCLLEPCVSTVADAMWEAPDAYAASAGYALGAHGGVVWVGAPSIYGEGPPYVERLALTGLEPTGRWTSDWYDLLGTVIAAEDLDGDGVAEVLLGDGSYTDGATEGALHLLAGDADSGDIVQRAQLSVFSPEWQLVGASAAFGAVGDSAAIELVVGAPGSESNDDDGFVYAVDATLRGAHGLEVADRSIHGPPGLAARLGVWDGDADGQDDIVWTQPGGVAWMLGPWLGDLESTDADGVWTERIFQDDLGSRLVGSGDVTGDGAGDLLMAAPNYEQPVTRAGRAYVVTATDLVSQRADDLPLQIHGSEVGHGMGYGLAAADIDGDGQDDLVVAASGVSPGKRTGEVLVYPGPVAPGVLEAEDAAIVVYGEYFGDLFGRSLAVVDADGDTQDDLVVGAQSWPAGRGHGAVYLLLGADLWP